MAKHFSALLEIFVTWQGLADGIHASLMRVTNDHRYGVQVPDRTYRKASVYIERLLKVFAVLGPEDHPIRLRGFEDQDAVAYCLGLVRTACVEMSQDLGQTGKISGDSIDHWIHADNALRLELESFVPLLRERASNEVNEKSGLTYQEVAKRLETLQTQGQAFTSQRKLAADLGCSPSTINRAIKETPSLDLWANPERCSTPRAISLNPVVTDNVSQRCEHDPSEIVEDADVDRAMRYLLEEAKPEERAKINAMSQDKRRELAMLVANDPDKYNRVLSRKP
ncbi:MAG TPA: helix-turn-helix domain-containing protein [Thermoguttaceae bacterium]|nr:helix-turn-helix domain-containing protein [Thermoguttaceae bacterium]